MLLIRVDHADHDHDHNQTGSYQGGALVNVEQIKSIHGRTQNGAAMTGPMCRMALELLENKYPLKAWRSSGKGFIGHIQVNDYS